MAGREHRAHPGAETGSGAGLARRQSAARAGDIGRLYSPHPAQARQAASALRNQQATLAKRYAGGATLQSQILALCGGRNVFAASPVPWPQVSREQVLIRHPQVIIAPGDATAARQVSDFWRPQLTVPVIAVNEDSFTRPGPRILLAARQLCAQPAQLRSALPVEAP